MDNRSFLVLCGTSKIGHLELFLRSKDWKWALKWSCNIYFFWISEGPYLQRWTPCHGLPSATVVSWERPARRTDWLSSAGITDFPAKKVAGPSSALSSIVNMRRPSRSIARWRPSSNMRSSVLSTTSGSASHAVGCVFNLLSSARIVRRIVQI